jgi:hypothetical protein
VLLRVQRAQIEILRAGILTTLPRSQQAERQVRHNTPMRQARTCYDHLAGVAGVQLLDAMLQRGWLVPNGLEEHARTLYHLTSQGTQALRERGVDVVRAAQTRRRFAFGCIDWTERRTHLGGALGAAILEVMVTDGLVQRQQQSRSVVCQMPVVEWLDTSSSRPTP